MRQLAPALKVRRMTLDDLPQVMEIERAAFTNPWNTEMVKNELGHDWSTILLAEDESGGVQGFAIFWLVHDELHILNVATHPALRRRGIGRFVLDEVLQFARHHRCRVATLEVRRGNEAALGLYRALGFRTVGMRPNYYTDDREDAVVMLLDFT